MFVSLRNIVKRLTASFILAGCFVLSLPAQVIEKVPGETEVPILQGLGSRYYGCYVENAVLDKEAFEKIKADRLMKDCHFVKGNFNIDFDKYSMIVFRTGGDCFVRASARVYRNDEAKKYAVRIKRIFGGCRAAGSFQGWLMIDKMRPDYKADFVVTNAEGDDSESPEDDQRISLVPGTNSLTTETLETRHIDIKNCIPTYQQKRFVIKDKEAYSKAVPNDMRREKCLKDAEKIDFNKYTLFGKEINSGYCGIPIGLRHQMTKDTAKKQYFLNISYIKPNEPCRAYSQHDFWLLVPKLPEGYEIVVSEKAEL